MSDFNSDNSDNESENNIEEPEINIDDDDDNDDDNSIPEAQKELKTIKIDEPPFGKGRLMINGIFFCFSSKSAII